MGFKFVKYRSYFFVLVIHIILCIQIKAKELTDEQKEQIFAEIKNCMESTKLTDEEFESIMAKKELPTSKEGKCFTKCLMEKMEYLEEGGKINVIAVQAGLEENMEKESEITKAKEIIQQCADTVPPEDSCEYAYGISQCMYTKMKEAGISGGP
uniref:Odorant binding protein 6 n=2 Tax=Mirini TaxID=236659 RepID=G8HHA7_APOLU|nr:odorant binding protein 6 [Apolygus lucorum]AMQ76491.1 odorant-binding protein 38 [Apolygus lucorum]ANA10232.1 odorant-binding protein 6 [Adelphocoris suturalis]